MRSMSCWPKVRLVFSYGRFRRLFCGTVTILRWVTILCCLDRSGLYGWMVNLLLGSLVLIMCYGSRWWRFVLDRWWSCCKLLWDGVWISNFGCGMLRSIVIGICGCSIWWVSCLICRMCSTFID